MNIMGNATDTYGKHFLRNRTMLRQQKITLLCASTRIAARASLLSAQGFFVCPPRHLLHDFRSQQYLIQAHQKMLLYYTISATKNC
jgi:hypothetical protein